MLNLKELRDGDTVLCRDGGKCWFVGLVSVGKLFHKKKCQCGGVNKIHKSHDILICKIFLLRKCQSGAGPDHTIVA